MMLLATLFGGLGLFFIGVKLIGGHLKRLGGRRFRQLVAHSTATTPRAALLGVLAGAISQSTNAVTFIVASMATADLLPARRALPILAWANVGTSALVLAATVNLHVAVLVLIGLTGLLYYLDLDRSERLRDVVGALLGIGLLFLGLQLIKEGALPLRDDPVIAGVIAFAGHFDLLAFMIGVIVTMVAQSSATVTVITVTLAMVGVIGYDPTVMIICGASLGSGLATLLLATNTDGIARRLIMLQLVIKAAGVLVILPLHFVGRWGGADPLGLVLDLAGADLGRRVALLYLLLQLAAVLVVGLGAEWLYRRLNRAFPDSRHEELGRPAFLYDQGLADPETAIDLINHEHARLFGYVTALLDSYRPDTRRPGDHLPVSDYVQAGALVCAAIERVCAGLVDGRAAALTIHSVLRTQNRNSLLRDLIDTTGSFVTAAQAIDSRIDGLITLSDHMAEVQHLMAGLLAEELIGPDGDQTATILTMTTDRSELMERLRRTVLAEDDKATGREHDQLFTLTGLFERAVWLVHRYARLLQADRARDAA